MTLRIKLFLAMGMLSALVASIFVLSFFSFNAIESRVDHMLTDTRALQLLKDADGNAYRAAVAERSVIFLKPGSADFENSVAIHREALKNMDALKDSVSDLTLTESLMTSIEAYFSQYEKWHPFSVLKWLRQELLIRAQEEERLSSSASVPVQIPLMR